MLHRFSKAITHHSRYSIAIYDVSGMLIFDIDFTGHLRSAVKTLKVLPHLKMFLKPRRCNTMWRISWFYELVHTSYDI